VWTRGRLPFPPFLFPHARGSVGGISRLSFFFPEEKKWAPPPPSFFFSPPAYVRFQFISFTPIFLLFRVPAKRAQTPPSFPTKLTYNGYRNHSRPFFCSTRVWKVPNGAVAGLLFLFFFFSNRKLTNARGAPPFPPLSHARTEPPLLFPARESGLTFFYGQKSNGKIITLPFSFPPLFLSPAPA